MSQPVIAAAHGITAPSATIVRRLRSTLKLDFSDSASDKHKSGFSIHPLADLAGFKKYLVVHAVANCPTITITFGRFVGVDVDFTFAICPAGIDKSELNYESIANFPGARTVFIRKVNTAVTETSFTLNVGELNITDSLIGVAPGLHAPALVIGWSTEEVVTPGTIASGAGTIYVNGDTTCSGFGWFA